MLQAKVRRRQPEKPRPRGAEPRRGEADLQGGLQGEGGQAGREGEGGGGGKEGGGGEEGQQSGASDGGGEAGVE